MGRNKTYIIEESLRKELNSRIFSKFNSQKELAEALGITESTLTTNLQKATSKFLARLSILGIYVDDLISGDFLSFRQRIDHNKENIIINGDSLGDMVKESKINFGKGKSQTEFDELAKEVEKLKIQLIMANAEIKVYKELYGKAMGKITEYERSLGKVGLD